MKILINILILFLAINFVSAEFNPKVDTSIFPLGNDSARVDISYNISSEEIGYIFIEELFEANVNIKATIISNTSKDSISWQLNSKLENLDINHIIFGMKSIILKNNQYVLNLEFTDINSKKVKRKKVNIIIPNISNKSINISDISFAYKFIKKENNINFSDELLKGDIYIIPNASKEYDALKTELHTYFELRFGSRENKFNKTDTENKINQNLKITYKILDASKRIQYIYSKNLKIYNKLYSDYENIPIAYLPTGLYYVSIGVTVENLSEILKLKKFYIYNAEIAPNIKFNFTEDVVFESSIFSTMKVDELKEEYRKTKIILNSKEIEEFDRLQTHVAKQRALYKYWKIRDTDTTTAINERRNEMQKAIRYANKRYSTSNIKNGWLTNRGRILLKYGFPTSVDVFYAKGYKNACEIWHYDEMEGGTKFYFVDNFKNDNFRLVHSTMTTEIQDFDWVRKFKPAIEKTDYINPNEFESNQNNPYRR